MHEIFFRGKAKDDGKWVGGYYVYQPNNVCVGHSNEKHYIYQYHFLDWNLYEYIKTEVDPNTVGQFTGFIDTNKFKIFENDIVELNLSSGGTERYLIWYNNEGNLLTAVNLDGLHFNGTDYYNARNPRFTYDTFCLMMQDPYGHIHSTKVIGNLHDNPELLEV